MHWDGEHGERDKGCATARDLATNLEDVSDAFTWAKFNEVAMSLPGEGLFGHGITGFERLVGVSMKQVGGGFDVAGLRVERVE